MSITFHLPGPLVPYAAGNSELVYDGSCQTVGDALAALGERYPALADRILNERGDLRPHVNVFVDRDDIRYMGGLRAGVPDGATVWIVPAVSGG